MLNMFTIIGMSYISFKASKFIVYLGIATHRAWQAMKLEADED